MRFITFPGHSIPSSGVAITAALERRTTSTTTHAFKGSARRCCLHEGSQLVLTLSTFPITVNLRPNSRLPNKTSQELQTTRHPHSFWWKSQRASLPAWVDTQKPIIYTLLLNSGTHKLQGLASKAPPLTRYCLNMAHLSFPRF